MAQWASHLPEGKPVSAIVVIRPDSRESVELTATITGLDLFGTDRSIVAMRVNGETRDLQRQLSDGDEVTPVFASSDEGLSILRHSAAHVTAQALQHLFVEAKLGIGPPITDGFYYDFATAPLTPEDLKAIEKQMAQIVREKQRPIFPSLPRIPTPTWPIWLKPKCW